MNSVNLTGTIDSEFKPSIKKRGEKLFLFYLSSIRLSGTVDRIPCLVPDRIIDTSSDLIGVSVSVFGRIYTYNHKNKLMINVLVENIQIQERNDDNSVNIDGFLCKIPNNRTTPNGRIITDLMIASNYGKFKSDYIPCICWGKNAIRARDFKIGDHIKVTGRLQSRDYVKKISEKETEVRAAYEVSIKNMEVVESEERKDQVSDAK